MMWHHSLILGIIEGLTEFLPISSTGHMIIASHFMQMNPTEFHKAFEVIIQSGAILSVLLLYWKKFLVGSKEKFFKFYSQLFLAFIPTAISWFFTERYRQPNDGESYPCILVPHYRRNRFIFF